MKPKGKFSFLESGILLIVMGIVLIAISSNVVSLYFTTPKNLNEVSISECVSGDVVILDIYDSAGVCFYNCPEGCLRYPDLVSTEYDRGYVVTLRNPDKNVSSEYQYIPVDVSDNSYKNWLDSTTKTLSQNAITDVTDLIPLRVRGQITDITKYEQINAVSVISVDLGLPSDDAFAALAPFTVQVNNPIDDFVKFGLGSIASITGIAFIVIYIKKRSMQKAQEENGTE